MKKLFLTISIVSVSFGLGFAFNGLINHSKKTKMNKVTGIGGVFFKCKDNEKVKEWYNAHLGMNAGKYGANFEWRQAEDSTKKGTTAWNAFSDKTKYLEPSEKDFMINYRVDNLEELVAQLTKDGVTVVDKIEDSPYGKFVHIMDIEGNKIELWEPKD
jgi:predicted enzyme related to lactoylglutathione lyase